MENEVVNYIKEAKTHGLSETEIKQNLLNVGWEAGVVEESFAYVKAAENHTPPAGQNMPAGQQKPAADTQEPIRPVQQQNGNTATKQNGNVQPLTNDNLYPSLAASDSHFQNQNIKKPFYKRPLLYVALLAMILVAGGAYAYYTYIFNSPAKIWVKYLQGQASNVYQTNFALSYTDKGELKSGGLNLKDIKLKINGDLYTDITNPNEPQSSAKLDYSFSSGNTGFNTGFEYRLVNQKLYVNIGDNPFLNNIIQSAAKGKKIDWVSLDLVQMQNEMQKSGATENDLFNEIFNPGFKDELQKMWADASFVKMDKFLGREKIGNANTFHFQNSLDKQAIKNTLNATVTKIVKAFNEKSGQAASSTPEGLPTAISDKELETVNNIVNALVDKIEIKDFQTWVGVKDMRLYKVHLVSNAPSVISAISVPLEAAQASSRDAKRLSDMRQMSSALELYFNDKGGYPESKDGIPQGLTPSYIFQIPAAPSPADNGCTDYYNAYWYEPAGKKSVINGNTVYESYEMTFCLGSNIGGYANGIAKITPQGIQGNISCPSTPENCGNIVPVAEEPELTPEQQITEYISKMPFSAEFNIDATYSNYGQKSGLQPPANTTDLMELMQSGSVLGAFTNALTKQY